MTKIWALLLISTTKDGRGDSHRASAVLDLKNLAPDVSTGTDPKRESGFEETRAEMLSPRDLQQELQSSEGGHLTFQTFASPQLCGKSHFVS